MSLSSPLWYFKFMDNIARLKFMQIWVHEHRLCIDIHVLVNQDRTNPLRLPNHFYSNCSLSLIIKILINRGCLTHGPHVSTFKSIAFPQFSHPRISVTISISLLWFCLSISFLLNPFASFFFPFSFLSDSSITREAFSGLFSPSLFHSSSPWFFRTINK